jgi:cobalt/nickel transport system permease protein
VQKLLSDFFLLEETPRRPGLLQRIDPRVKLVTLLISVVLTTLSHSLPALTIFYAATLVLAAASRLSIPRFVLRTWLFIPLFTAAMVLPLVFTRAGASLAALLVLRTATAVSWSLLLVFTTRWSKLFAAMEILRVPRIFVWSLQMMVRYLQMLARQMEELQWALKSRILGTLRVRQGQRVVAQHMGLLFQKSLAASEEVYAGLRSRGYMGAAAPALFWALTRRDYAWIAAWLVGVIVWKAHF